MCARRNQQAHARLIGESVKCDETIPAWRGNYPKGLSVEQFERAQGVRRALWSKGARVAEIVDAFESIFGRITTAQGTTGSRHESLASRASFGSQVQENLKALLIRHWSSLKWGRPLVLFREDVPLGDYGMADIVAFDPSTNTAVLIELQLDRDELEVVETLSFYLDLFRAHSEEGMSMTGIIVANKPSEECRRKAKAVGIELYMPDISATNHLSSPDSAKIKVRVKRCT